MQHGTFYQHPIKLIWTKGTSAAIDWRAPFRHSFRTWLSYSICAPFLHGCISQHMVSSLYLDKNTGMQHGTFSQHVVKPVWTQGTFIRINWAARFRHKSRNWLRYRFCTLFLHGYISQHVFQPIETRANCTIAPFINMHSALFALQRTWKKRPNRQHPQGAVYLGVPVHLFYMRTTP